MSFQVIFTLGPASGRMNCIQEFLSVADKLRINCAHQSMEKTCTQLKTLQKLMKGGVRVPVVLDLQGAKMRVGRMTALKSLPKKLDLVQSRSCKKKNQIPVPHPEFFVAVQEGDTLTLNDARIELLVEKKEENRLQVRVVKNGPLSAFKGINRKSHPIPYTQLTAQDRLVIERSGDFDFVEYAFSFTHTGNEAKLIRPISGDRKLTAKIERAEAFGFMKNIDENFDELWLCRGDMGAQVGILNLPLFQEKFMSELSGLSRPSWLAGQVLEHMTHFPEPTRSEVVHLYQSLRSGFVGVVLSDETAIGKNPLAVAAWIKTAKLNSNEWVR